MKTPYSLLFSFIFLIVIAVFVLMPGLVLKPDSQPIVLENQQLRNCEVMNYTFRARREMLLVCIEQDAVLYWDSSFPGKQAREAMIAELLTKLENYERALCK